MGRETPRMHMCYTVVSLAALRVSWISYTLFKSRGNVPEHCLQPGVPPTRLWMVPRAPSPPRPGSGHHLAPGQCEVWPSSSTWCPAGAPWHPGLGGMWGPVRKHQCFHHPGTTDTLQPHMSCPAPEGASGQLDQHMVWQWVWGSNPSTNSSRGCIWPARGGSVQPSEDTPPGDGVVLLVHDETTPFPSAL